MAEAARLTDMTAHGGVITAPGCAGVLVEFLPAARVGDQHVCPASVVFTPHVGGPIVQGVRDVKIGTQFASRVSDNALCHGPVDVIVHGASDVLIAGTVLTFHTSQHGGNTLVAVDPETKTIYIESFLEYHGPGASQAYADAAKKVIEGTWGGTCQYNGETYNVDVDVHTSVSPDGTPTPGYDPIAVDPATTRANQTLYGDGEGNQSPSNAAPGSWVPAHEYGHTLGLDDEYHDTPTGSVPNDPTKTNNIMSQTWPGPNGEAPHTYQGQYDGVMKNYGW
jgi:uncharacterized Zn-binding protein involved in type VI secretion